MAPPVFNSFIISPRIFATTLRALPAPPARRNIIPISAAWFLPNNPLTGKKSFLEGHIPNSRFFDLDKVCDPDSPYPHMLPSASLFAKALTELGIRKDDTVVVYDAKEVSVFSAPRVAWMFKVFNHERVHVLDNFKGWIEEGYPVEKGEEEVLEAGEDYPVPNVNLERAASFVDVKALVGSDKVQIIDARPAGRFKGVDKEPREGISSGHIPGAISLPFSEVLRDGGKSGFKEEEELTELLKAKVRFVLSY